MLRPIFNTINANKAIRIEDKPYCIELFLIMMNLI